MEKLIIPSQHKRVLFLISLPCEPKFEKDRDEIDKCLHELRELQVDVREHIWREDLADAIKYDIVIVVTEHDIDQDILCLHRGNLSMQDFISSLPKGFTGVLDFASCYSIMSFPDIKGHCPFCKLQASLGQTSLLRRIVMYPSVIEKLYENPTMDYRTAYKTVSKEFDEIVEEVNPEEEVEMTHLGGRQMSEIYARREVKRDSTIKIFVFFNYNEEEKVIEIQARMLEKKSELCGKTCEFSATEGDEITITISFDSTDNDNIKVKNDEDTKTVTLKDEWVAQWFIVYILPDFKGNNFQTNIKLEKGGIPIVKFIPFDIDIIEKEDKANIGSKSEDSNNQDATLLSGEVKMKRIIQAIKKVVEDDLILKKQDWAAIYRVLQEDNYYTLTIQSFVDIIKEQSLSKRIVPASDSNLRKISFHTGKDYKFPNWKIESANSSMNDDETSRLVHLAKTFMSYCKQ